MTGKEETNGERVKTKESFDFMAGVVIVDR
jgi:hypothetical protein